MQFKKELHMSKPVISTILIILVLFLGMAIFLKYYSRNNSSTNNISTEGGKNGLKLDQVSKLNTENINNFRRIPLEEKEVSFQVPIPQDDVNTMEQDEISPIQDVSDIVKGQEDENGVRHDINVWISKQDLNSEQKLALTQMAKTIQSEIVQAEQLKKFDIKTARKQAEILSVDSLRALDCILSRFNNDLNSFDYVDKIRKLTLNTKARIEADQFIDQALSGAAIIYPEGNACEK